MKKAAKLPTLLLLAFTVIGTSTVGASTRTNSLNVSATVNTGCIIVSATDISFGDYSAVNASPLDAQGNFVLKCSKDIVYATYIAGVRQMNSGGNTVDFELYTDAARNVVWPSTVATAVLATSLDYVNVTSYLYGRVPAGQNKPEGVYLTAVTATLEW